MLVSNIADCFAFWDKHIGAGGRTTTRVNHAIAHRGNGKGEGWLRECVLILGGGGKQTPKPGNQVAYTVRPRCTAGGSGVCQYVVSVRVRGCVHLNVGGTALGAGRALCARGEWGWVEAGMVSLKRDVPAVVTVAAAEGAAAHFDALRLVSRG